MGVVIALAVVLVVIIWGLVWLERRDPPEVDGAHDAGVWVDEEAWAEIVRELRSG